MVVLSYPCVHLLGTRRVARSEFVTPDSLYFGFPSDNFGVGVKILILTVSKILEFFWLSLSKTVIAFLIQPKCFKPKTKSLFWVFHV